MTNPQLTEEEKSKDRFFERLGDLAQEMIDAHGKEFTMGTLVLAARFIADGKPIGRPGKPNT
jgi:uncharacterized membrane protein YheB (UPF0754 family)